MSDSWTVFSEAAPRSAPAVPESSGAGGPVRSSDRAEFSATCGGHAAGPSATMPDTRVLLDGARRSGAGGPSAGAHRGPPSGASGAASGAGGDLMAAMRDALAGSVTTGKRRTTPLEHSVLAGIAEDAELSRTYGTPSEVTAEMVRAVAECTIRAIRATSAAQQVSLCFVVDTTGGMAAYIEGVRCQVRAIVEQVRRSGCEIAGLAFVGYKDWYDGFEHFEVLRFVREISDFERFVSRVGAGGGGDFPEDVVGGLYRAVGLEWPEGSGSRVIFHIADSPPHGRKGGQGQHYHDMQEDHPDGHPSDVPLPTLFEAMRRQGVDYYFGKINEQCQGMLEIFGRHLGRAIEPCDVANPASIASSVSSSIMDSVSRRSAAAFDSGRPAPRLPPMDKTVPKWAMVPVSSATVMTLELPESAEHIRRMEPLKQKVQKGFLQVAPRPFANGSVRLAYFARRLFTSADPASGGAAEVRDVPRNEHGPFFNADEIVLKGFIKASAHDGATRSRYMVDLETQAVAAKLALDFNERLSRTTRAPSIRIKYLMAKLVRFDAPDMSSTPSSLRFMAMEKKFRGEVEMTKYTNNYEFVRAGDSEEFQVRSGLAVAFSHFTYEHTDGYCMVTDVQGVDSKDGKDRGTMLLTDPAIHCPGVLRFGKTNMQQAGVDAFFKVHVCNRYCQALGLPDRGWD